MLVKWNGAMFSKTPLIDFQVNAKMVYPSTKDADGKLCFSYVSTVKAFFRLEKETFTKLNYVYCNICRNFENAIIFFFHEIHFDLKFFNISEKYFYIIWVYFHSMRSCSTISTIYVYVAMLGNNIQYTGILCLVLNATSNPCS